jgi:alkanesulfonate monooxygenase SsuD/methylene tetrahydromethanopterin reductase-like flavin-dependent oxidoreductase (luciferase family)
MRTATTIEASGHGSWSELVGFVAEADKLGLDICWVAEAWGSDAPSPLGFLAARTERMLLGSGVIQLGTRTPAAIAQTAMTLAHMSQGRFLLGLGASGPQVMEGLHGVPFGRPLRRMRETVEIVRAVFSGEKVSYQGDEFTVPLAGGEARPMRVSVPPVDVPIYLAALSPKMLELTGRVAEAGRTRADLDICQGAEVNFARDEDDLARIVGSRKKELAFSLGGMGSGSTNFYNNAYSRQGWADAAAEIRAAWQSGDRETAVRLVTDDMVLATTLIGTEDMVRARLRVWRDVGVDTVRLYPAGDTMDARLEALARALDLVREVG